MPHEFEEHLLSAYLDDELSADERALVEERLKIDPAARQLFEDLKRVRSLVATLPRWQGGDENAALPNAVMPKAVLPNVVMPNAAPLNAAALNAEPAADIAQVPTEPATPLTAHQVDYSSTSLAESRLRRPDRTAAMRTQRSMRWTTIVAVAAGLATLMLGAPYLFRSHGPVTEIAQHTDSAPEPAARGSADKASTKSTAAPPAGQQPPQGASDEAAAKATEEKASPANADVFFAQPKSNSGVRANAPREPSSGALRDGAESMGRTAPAVGLTQREPNAPAAQAPDRQSGGAELSDIDALARGGAAGSGATAPQTGPASNATPAPAAALAAPAETASAPGLKRSGESLGLRVLNDESGPARGALAPPTVQAPMARAFQSDVASRNEPGRDAPGAPSATATTAESRLVAARSEAWSDEEVDAAMNRVWYFVDPGAVASRSGAQQGVSQQAAGGTPSKYRFALPAGPATTAPSDPTLAYDAKPDKERLQEQAEPKRALPEKPNDKAALGKATTDAPIQGGAAVAEVAAQATTADMRGRSAPAAAIGLARLPSGENPTAWLERLEQERSLKPLPSSLETESVSRARETPPGAEPSQRDAAVAAGEKAKASATQTIVLFVSASEARQILQSLESEKKQAAPTQQQAQQATKDTLDAAPAEGRAAGNFTNEELPPAWWTRPRALSKQNAGDAQAASDEKVILILSQLPRG